MFTVNGAALLYSEMVCNLGAGSCDPRRLLFNYISCSSCSLYCGALLTVPLHRAAFGKHLEAINDIKCKVLDSDGYIPIFLDGSTVLGLVLVAG